MKDWRLTSDVVAFIVNKDTVYFADPSKKKYIDPVKRIFGGASAEIHLTNKNFKAQIKKDVILVKNESLPDKDLYYKVGNIDPSNIFEIAEGSTILRGDIQEEFELVFHSEATAVRLITKSMSSYKETLEEMRRRLNCEIYSRTKNWKVGYRYDSIDSSLYYLGEVSSHKIHPTNSSFYETPQRTVHLFVTEIDEDTEKSVSEVIKKRLYVKDEKDRSNRFRICMRDNVGTLVESGKYLEDDVTSIKSLWEDMVNTYLEKKKKQYSPNSSLYFHEDVSSLLRIFDYTDLTDGEVKISDSIKSKVEEVISEHLYKYLVDYYDLTHYHVEQSVNSKKGRDKNVDALISYFYYSLDDSNTLKISYYSDLFKKIGIDLKQIADKTLTRFECNKDSFDNDIESLLDYENYYKRHDYNKYNKSIDQRSLKTSASYKTLNDAISGNHLRDAIMKLFKEARDSFGGYVEKYEIINCGTLRKPTNITTCTISIMNIINYFGGIDKMSEFLKKDIIGEKFFYITIWVPENEDLK